MVLLETITVHRLLEKQLKKFKIIDIETSINSDILKQVLGLVSEAYRDADADRYLLERSLKISSQELCLMNEAQKESYDCRLKAIIKAIPDLIFLNDEDGNFLEVFLSDDKDFNFVKDKLLGKCYQELFPEKLSTFFKTTIKTALQENRLIVIEYDLKMPEGVMFYEARIMPTGFFVDNKETVMVIARNITEAKTIEAKLHYTATHDDLTQLPNRPSFYKKLKKSIKHCKKNRCSGVLFFLDLDRFKEINDNLGHDIGDKLLIKVAKRLKKITQKKDVLARFGGDEFVLVVENISSHDEIIAIAEKIMHQFTTPFPVKKYQLDITSSMGISIFPQNANTPIHLIKQTDIAMYQAKALGKNNFHFFTEELAEKSYEEFNLEAQLKNALKNEEFHLVYQPQIRLKDKKMIGVEALIRWENKIFGTIPPMKFIPIAEKCGLIELITNWVIEEVCRQIKIWDNQGCEPFAIAINLSRKEIGKMDMFERITNIINQAGIPHHRIEFEMTESALLENISQAFKNIEKLRFSGFMVAIDDFGTGYSSLSNLKNFFFDKLKIDQTFVQEIGFDTGDEVIIKATIALAKSLNLKVIAEGVETQEQHDFLIKYGCDEVQGHFYSYPIKPEYINQTLYKKL